MAIVSSGSLMDAVRRYELLPKEQLAQLPHLIKGRCADARPLARLLVQRGWLTVYQMNQLLADHGNDLTLGPYHIIDRLGQGGQSLVYKARHREHSWEVALKVIRTELAANPEAGEQFLQEMEAMAALDHPNIVEFCDADLAENTFYCAMEYIEGTDLSKQVSLMGVLSPRSGRGVCSSDGPGFAACFRALHHSPRHQTAEPVPDGRIGCEPQPD